jgi:hypothetical protein
MALDLPTGSVRGREEWEWTRLNSKKQEEGENRRHNKRSDRETPSRIDESGISMEDIVNENEKLRQQLEKKDDRMTSIIERYERILRERDYRF